MIFTNCGGCKFSESFHGVQSGCAANRLNKYHELNITKFNEENKHYDILGRFCNMLRPPTFEGTVEEASEENSISVGFVLVFNDDIAELKERLDDIWLVNARVKVSQVTIVHDRPEYNEEILSALRQLVEDGIPYFVVFDVVGKPYLRKLDDGFANAKNGFTYMGRCQDSINQFSFSILNKIVNDDLKQVLATIPQGQNFIVNSGVYKALGGNAPMKIGENIDNRTFFDRLADFKDGEILGDDFWQKSENALDRWMNGN